MKILHVHDHYVPCGGAEVYFTDIVNSLEDKGHENVILYSATKDLTHRRGRIREYFIPPRPGLIKSLPLVKEVRKIINEVNPDIIHIHGFHGNMSPLIVKIMRTMKPTVHTAHDIMAFCFNGRKIHRKETCLCTRGVGWGCLLSKCLRPFKEGTLLSTIKRIIIQSFEMRQYRRLQKIIVASNYMKGELIRNGVSPENITVLYYFLNTHTTWITHKHEEKGSNTILYIGRIEKNKGVGEFIEILSMIKDTPWKAKIIGQGSYEGEVRKKIDTLGLSHNVEMIGFIPHKDLHHYYTGASVIVVPSYYPEPFGLTGIEAMYFGKPVVAFHVGGIGEWLHDQETGFLVPFPDKGLFAKKIECLLQDKYLANTFGEKGQEAVKKFIQKEAHIDRLLQIYQEAIQQGKSGH